MVFSRKQIKLDLTFGWVALGQFYRNFCLGYIPDFWNCSEQINEVVQLGVKRRGCVVDKHDQVKIWVHYSSIVTCVNNRCPFANAACNYCSANFEAEPSVTILLQVFKNVLSCFPASLNVSTGRS